MKKQTVATLSACLMGAVHADEKIVTMHLVDADRVGEAVGTLIVSSTPRGVLFAPHLRKLSPHLYGFHVHENSDSAPAKDEGEMTAAIDAGGRNDPQHTERHEGPYGQGHLGDLPSLYIDATSHATHPVVAPRLHRDNCWDKPVELGGGGPRMACGVVGL